MFCTVLGEWTKNATLPIFGLDRPPPSDEEGGEYESLMVSVYNNEGNKSNEGVVSRYPVTMSDRIGFVCGES